MPPTYRRASSSPPSEGPVHGVRDLPNPPLASVRQGDLLARIDAPRQTTVFLQGVLPSGGQLPKAAWWTARGPRGVPRRGAHHPASLGVPRRRQLRSLSARPRVFTVAAHATSGRVALDSVGPRSPSARRSRSRLVATATGARAPFDGEFARADVVPMYRMRRVRPSGASVGRALQERMVRPKPGGFEALATQPGA